MSVERLNDLPLLFNRLNLDNLSDIQLTTIAKIDACLPQTHCGLCDHPDGCLPYAAAIVLENEAHNKCVPGGQPVTDAIAKITHRDPLPARPSAHPIDPNTKRPTEVRAIIREDDCIGCTKCIPACPVDAIIGTGKHMHTIITDLCTGCELCLAPCPVDCIDLITAPRHTEDTPAQRQQEQAHLRRRYHTHLNRVATQMSDGKHSRPVTSMVEAKLGNEANHSIDISESQAKHAIEAAKLRSKIKKLEKQLRVRHNDDKQAELTRLQEQLNRIDPV